MLEVHKIVKGSHVVVCRIVFTLFYDRDGQEGGFKIVKNDCFLVFLVV